MRMILPAGGGEPEPGRARETDLGGRKRPCLDPPAFSRDYQGFPSDRRISSEA